MKASLWEVSARSILIAAGLGVLAAPGLEAQQQPQQQRTFALAYRKSLPGKAADHRKFIETGWKKWAQAAVDEGVYHSAMALRLTAPYTTGAPFDYALVTFPIKHPSLAPPVRAVGEARAKKAGFANLQAYLDAVDTWSSAVKTEWLNAAIRIGSIQEGNYLRSARYMVEPTQMTEQMNWLREGTLPMYKHAMKDGRVTGFGVSTLPGMLGTADEAGFNLSVFAVFKDAEAPWAGPAITANEANIKGAFPNGITLANYINRNRTVNEHRKNISTRIWEVVALVGKSPEITPALN